MSLMPSQRVSLRIVLPGIHVVEIGFRDVALFAAFDPGQTPAQVIVRHHHAANLLIPLRLVLFNPAQE